MLRDLFRTKERKIITVVFGVAVIIMLVLAFIGYMQKNRFLEQAVMAENYLKVGSYDKAIKAYEKALSLKNNDKQNLTIGLAEAYAGINNYDKALEVLRSYYSKSSEIRIKEKIEEVIAAKNDYEYLQSISHAEVYYTNGEYLKAIEEFQQAKQIKRKEVTPYQRIAGAYIELGEYDLAKEEVLQGQEITQNKSLDITMKLVESYIKLEQYKEIVDQAAEYICQENFQDGIDTYLEAAQLLPKESQAYVGLVRAYITLKEYNKASSLLREVLTNIQSEELKNLQIQVSELIELENEKNSIISRLYDALKERRITVAMALMEMELFEKEIAPSGPVYYSEEDSKTNNGVVLVIYDSSKIYYGFMKDGKRSSKGIYFMLTEGNKEKGYYYYDGEWELDIPSGSGKTVEMDVMEDDNGLRYENKTITEGIYNNALEEGRMTKYFYTKDKEVGKLIYTADNGIPLPMIQSKNQPYPTPGSSNYVIGIIQNENTNGEYYRVGSDTIWGVKPFLSKK